MTVSLETVSSTHNTRQGPRAPPTSGGAKCAEARAARTDALSGPDTLRLPERLVAELADILADALMADLRSFPALQQHTSEPAALPRAAIEEA